MRYHLKLALRFFYRNKGYALASVIGLSISLTLIVLLSVYIHGESSVDSQHANADKIYRVLHSNECAFSPPFGSYLLDNIHELNAYCRTFCLEGVLKTEHNMVRTEKCFYADSNFFTMFSFPLLEGKPKEVLSVKNKIVLSKSYSTVLFGNENPIGKKVVFNSRLEYTVSGIADDFGEETHFKAVDVIIPFGAMDDFLGGNNTYLNQFDWRFFLPALYVASNGNDLNKYEAKILPDVKKWYWLFNEDENASLHFQPLNQVYLNEAGYGYVPNVRSGNANVLKLTAFIILAVCLIAFINFINLTISKANNRLAEITVKRINGANNRHLISLFLTEQSLIAIATLVVFSLLLIVSLPFFNQLLGYHVSFVKLFHQVYLLKVTGLFLIISIITGSLVLFSTVRFYKRLNSNLVVNKIRIGFLQRSLVIFQYTMSIALIISMIFIIKQKNYIESYDLGFNKKKTLFIKLNREFKGRAEVFKNKISKVAGVNKASLCNGMPGLGIFDLRFVQDGQVKKIDLFQIDEDFFETMDIDVGTNSKLDNESCWINESAAKALNYNPKEGIVKIEEFNESKTLKVAGVLPDMNFHSLHEKARPTIFSKIDSNAFIDYLLLNIEPRALEEILTETKKIYTTFSTNFPFDYALLNDTLNQKYEKETRTLKLITWFALFGIILSSVGMLSLALLLINKKTKEIGIRKVNGAKVIEVMTMINKHFLIWVIIAFGIATPIAWYTMHKWLENFAYKTELSWWIFALAGFLALVVALLTVSWQSWRAAARNPVESLRYE